jgi:hypothetical protein
VSDSVPDPGEGRLRRVLALARAHRPGLRLVDKHESVLMRAAAVLVRPFMPHFLTRVTTVIGDTIYTPGPPEELPPGLLARIVAHELVHQIDQARYGPLFYLSNALLPLPVWRTSRAWWERRAFAVDLMLAHHDDGPAGLEMARRRLAVVFGGPTYAWMWGGRLAAERFLQGTVDAVAEGELQASAPYDDILHAWSEPQR